MKVIQETRRAHHILSYPFRSRRGRDRLVVGFTTSYAIGAYRQ